MRTIVCTVASVFILALGAARAGEDFKLEPGFVLLFNGKNLDGWKTQKGESLEGKTEAYNNRFKVEGGKLILDPKVKTIVIINTAKEFPKDVTFRFDFLPGPGCNNDLYFRGHKFDLVPKLKGFKEGEWNKLEITAQGDKVEFKVNGEAGKTAKTAANNLLAIRAEFGPMEIKNIRVKE